MRRWTYQGLFLLSALALCYLAFLWNGLSGQMLFRLKLPPNAGARSALFQIASDAQSEFAAFALRDAPLQLAGDSLALSLRECIAYHPEALGARLVSGSPITHDQIERGEAVAMLSQTAAMRIDPAMDCVGQSIELGDRQYRVVGIYREAAPLGFLTRTAAASAIAPLPASEQPRRLHVWFRPKTASPFAFQQVYAQLSALTTPADSGEFQAVDLHRLRELNLQRARFWLFALLSALCAFLLKGMRQSRRQFSREARAAASAYYGAECALRLIGPALCGLLPTLMVLLVWALAALHCATNLVVNFERMPLHFLDPEAWLIQLEAASIAQNAREGMAVYPYLLNARLEELCPLFGILSALLLVLCLKTQKEKGDR